jgi:hypothetical protein
LVKPVVQYAVVYIPNSSTAQRVNYGTASVDDMKAHGEASFDTPKLAQDMYNIHEGTYINILQGVWVRVYTSDMVLVQEWSSAPNVTKKLTWSYASRGTRATKKPAATSGGTASAAGN